MRKSTLLVVLGFTLTLLAPVTDYAQQQEQVPTLEQCRADNALWGSNLKDELLSLPVQRLQDRAHILNSCSPVLLNQHGKDGILQADLDEALLNSELVLTYVSAADNRARNYLLRHGEYNSFLAEDAAGKR